MAVNGADNRGNTGAALFEHSEDTSGLPTRSPDLQPWVDSVSQVERRVVRTVHARLARSGLMRTFGMREDYTTPRASLRPKESKAILAFAKANDLHLSNPDQRPFSVEAGLAMLVSDADRDGRLDILLAGLMETGILKEDATEEEVREALTAELPGVSSYALAREIDPNTSYPDLYTDPLNVSGGEQKQLDGAFQSTVALGVSVRRNGNKG